MVLICSAWLCLRLLGFDWFCMVFSGSVRLWLVMVCCAWLYQFWLLLLGSTWLWLLLLGSDAFYMSVLAFAWLYLLLTGCAGFGWFRSVLTWSA